MKNRVVQRLLIVVSLLALILPASIQASQPTLAASLPKILTGSVPSFVANGQAHLVGHHSGTDHLSLAISLLLRNRPGLDQALKAASTPGHPGYGHYLTLTQENQEFNPTPQQEQRVITWLQTYGLTVTQTYPNHLLVDTVGTFAQIEHLLHITLNDYTLTSQGKQILFYAPANEPTVDGSVSSIVNSIVGLDNFPWFHTDVAAAHPTFTNGNAHQMPPYYPQDFANAYDVNPLWNMGDTGTGQHIGITLWGTPPSKSALMQFQKKTHAKAVKLQVIKVDGGSTALGGPEAGMDVEYTSGMAPGATIDYYEAPTDQNGNPTDAGLEDALNMAGSDANNNQQISSSWGGCEASSKSDPFTSAVEQILQSNTATGHDYFFSSGDNGSACVFLQDNPCGNNGMQDPYPQYPASSAYATSVGGTTFSGNINPGWPGEVALKYAPIFCFGPFSYAPTGSGGGYSKLFSEPSWQAGIPDPTNTRGYPDISADADPDTGAYICYDDNNGSTCTNPGIVGNGTSLASPLWAGMLADLNQYLQSQNKQPAGFINPTLYSIATHKQQYAPYHDIKKGTNGKYNAGKGWDAVTGWGSPDLYNLAKDIAPPSGGKLDWRYQTGDLVFSSPAVAGGVVYIGSGDDYVYALKASSGGLLWRYQTGNAVISSPTVVNGVVYVGSADTCVYALKASNGTLLWRYCTGNSVVSTPAVAGGVVYIGSLDVYALKASSGSLIWHYGIGQAFSSPVVAGGVVYVGSDDHYLYALNADSGALLWRYQTGDYVRSSPAVINGVLYVGSYDGYVYALDASNGTLLWRYLTGGSVYSKPAVVNGVLYVGSDDDYVYALNASNGTLLWRYQTGSAVWSSPAVVNGVLYVGSSDAYVYTLKAGDGTLLWRYQTGYPINSSPVVAKGVVYIGSYDFYVYAIYA